MKYGAYISMSDGFDYAVHAAKHFGCNTFMIYTASPRSFNRPAINLNKVKKGQRLMEEYGITDLIIHAPYICNPSSSDSSSQLKARSVISDELTRTNVYGSNLLVLHPGSHLNLGKDIGIEQLASTLNYCIKESSPTVCVETMAGDGTKMLSTFEEIHELYNLLEKPDKVKVCFDTCHVFDAGYDLNASLEAVLKEFDEKVGLDKIAVFHINGSLNACGSKRDRHAQLLAFSNKLNPTVLRELCNDTRFSDIPKILETPAFDNTNGKKKLYDYSREIQFLKGEYEL